MDHPQSSQRDLVPQKTSEGVRFTFTGSPHIHQVAVAGTFNNWVGDSCPLTRISATTWQTTLPIAPGRHLYKYVVDGTEWILDPTNPWVSEDSQNNSCLLVTLQGDVWLRNGDTSEHTPSPLYQSHRALTSPDWVQDAVIYQLAVCAFGGTFAGIQARLPYLVDLGVTVLWIMPFHPIGSAGRLGKIGDPYAVRDFTAIDERFGNAEALRVLVQACHQQGIRVLLDWTLNRSSIDSPLTRQHPGWFTHDAQGKINYEVPNRAYFAGFDFSNQSLRAYLLRALCQWVIDFDIDGFRFDDSDLTPLDFLQEIRVALNKIKPDIGVISQAYDELHHLAFCDLTYEGGIREIIFKIASGIATAADLQAYWQESMYSFPRGALRMRWLEEKEQGRAYHYYGAAVHRAAAALLLTLDGVPHLMMGQEFNEPNWKNWTSLFEEFHLDWTAFDQETFDHYRALIHLRRQSVALRRGNVTFLPEATNDLVGFWRDTDTERLLIIVNLSPHERTVPEVSTMLEGVYTYPPETTISHSQSLAPFGCRIFRALNKPYPGITEEAHP